MNISSVLWIVLLAMQLAIVFTATAIDSFSAKRNITASISKPTFANSVNSISSLTSRRIATIATAINSFSSRRNATGIKTKPGSRNALVIALAGGKKLTEYFSWSCRTIVDSRDRYDLLVFHENNQLLRNITCAENVRFYNLGERGLSKEIVRTVMGDQDASSDASQDLVKVVDHILQHIPTYLSELKPMMGSIFERYLSSYAYWSYTDPDIVFGSLSSWIDDEDLHSYHYYSIARNWDAGRLFLRSQLTLHRNLPEVNYLWQRLTYFKPQDFASRVGSIWRAITEAAEDKKRKVVPPSEAITRKFFHNPEGWYSKLVFEEGPGQVKIVGRVFDDFFREPVIRIRNPASLSSSSASVRHNPVTLLRCQQAMNVSHCIDHYYLKLKDPESATKTAKLFGVSEFPPPQMKEVEVHVEDPDACKMAWLPVPARSCVATEKFHHGSNHESNAAGKQQSQEHHDTLRLSRVGECVLSLPDKSTGERIWQCNDEKAAPRQVHEAAAFFHFHHWDEYVAMSKSISDFTEDFSAGQVHASIDATKSSAPHSEHHTHVTADCLVLYLRYDRALVLESCATAQKRESLLWSVTKTKLLLQHYVSGMTILKGQAGAFQSNLADSLSMWRKKVEMGLSAKEDGDSEEDFLRRENKRKKQRVMKDRSRRQQRRNHQNHANSEPSI